MINITKLEELQRVISTMEWDIQNGQFNKRKVAYYKKLLKERDDVLQNESADVYDTPANEEVEENEKTDERTDWEEKFEDRQIVEV